MYWQGIEQPRDRRRGFGALRKKCLYHVRRSQADRVDCQDSSDTKESETKNSRKVMQKQSVAARDHRTTSWAEQAASEDAGIIESDSDETCRDIGAVLRGQIKNLRQFFHMSGATYQASGITSESHAIQALRSGELFSIQRPVIFSKSSGYRAPSTLIFEAALSMSRRSSGDSSTAAAPMFSSRRFSFVVPGIGTIHGF